MLEWLEHIVTDYLGAYGYQAVLVLMILESACIPIPSEVTMVFGGFLASRGDLDFFWVAMVGTVANVVGSWLADWAGAGGGRGLIGRGAGYVLGNNWETVLRYGEPVTWVIAVTGVAFIAWWLGKRYRAKKAAEARD